MKIKIDRFKGLVPRVDSSLLPNENAVVCENVNLKAGVMRPLAGVGAVTAALNTGTVSSIYKYGSYWLSWAAGKLVNVVRSPVAMDTFSRLYWTGDDNAPRMGGTTKITTGGSGEYPRGSYYLGIPAPAPAATNKVSGFTITAPQAPGEKLTIPSGGSATAASSYLYVIPSGSTINGSVYIPKGVNHLTIHSLMATIYLPLPRIGYRFCVSGNVLSMHEDVGTVLIFTMAIHDSTAGNQVVFSDGSANFTITALNTAFFGGTAISSGAPTFVYPSTWNTAVTTNPGMSEPKMSEIESRTYVCTYVSEYGEEGPPSAASAVITMPINSTVAITTLPSASELGTTRYITKRRLYRSNTGSQGTEFQFVAELTTETTYSDVKKNEDLGEVCPSLTWAPPPTDLVGLISLPCGSLCGYRGNEVHFSVPFLPHAWDASYIKTFTEQVKGLGAYGTSVLVVTDGSPFVITGPDPSSMSVEQLENGTGCIARRGVVDMGYVVVYPSTEGLMMCGTSGVANASESLMTKAEWNSLFNASTYLAFHYDSQYIVFSSSGNYIFDPRDASLTSFVLTGVTVTGGWNDPSDGSLYLTTGTTIVKWGAGTALTMRWESKRFILQEPVNFGVMQVVADAYPVSVSVYVDGYYLDANGGIGPWPSTKSVANSLPFRLPGGFLSANWYVKVTGTNNVKSITLAETMGDLKES